MLAARLNATISVLQREHPHTCRYTQLLPQLLPQAIGNAGLDEKGWWQGMYAGLARKTPKDSKAEAVRIWARQDLVGLRQRTCSSTVHMNGTGLVFVARRVATAAESVAEATAHFRRDLGEKRHGGKPPSLAAQAVTLGLDLGDASLRFCLVGVKFGKNWVVTAFFAVPKQPPCSSVPRVHAWWLEKVLLVPANTALRKAMALTLLAREVATGEQLTAAT